MKLYHFVESYVLVMNNRTTFGILANEGRGMINELISLRGNFTVMKPAKVSFVV